MTKHGIKEPCFLPTRRKREEGYEPTDEIEGEIIAVMGFEDPLHGGQAPAEKVGVCLFDPESQDVHVVYSKVDSGTRSKQGFRIAAELALAARIGILKMGTPVKLRNAPRQKDQKPKSIRTPFTGFNAVPHNLGDVKVYILSKKRNDFVSMTEVREWCANNDDPKLRKLGQTVNRLIDKEMGGVYAGKSLSYEQRSKVVESIKAFVRAGFRAPRAPVFVEGAVTDLGFLDELLDEYTGRSASREGERRRDEDGELVQ